MDKAVRNRKKLDYSWVIVSLCFLMVFITLGFCSSNKGFYLDAVTRALGVERGLFAIGDSIRFATAAIVSMFFGTLVNKLGTKKLILAGFACLIGCMVIFSVGNNVWWFYLGNFLLGVGLSWTTTAVAGCVINQWCREKKGTIMGAVLAANGLGGAVAIQIVGPIIESGVWGYREAYRLVAAILFVSAVLILLFFREKPIEEKGEVKTVSEKKKGPSWDGVEFSAAKKTVCFFLMSAAVLMTGFVLQAINGVSITHMKDVGLSASYVALVSSIHSLTLTGFKFLTGVIYDKRGLRATTLICEVTAVLVMVAIIFVENSVMGMLYAMIYGVFSSLAMPLETVMLPIIAGDLFGQKSFNQMLGVFSAVTNVGLAIGSPIANVTFDMYGTYRPIFIICCVIMVVVTLISQLSITLSHKMRKSIEK